MQYKCMEKEIRIFHGRILFPSAMYIAREYSGRNADGRRDAMNLCI